MSSVEKECKGTLRVSQDVISEIAAAAATEVEGASCCKNSVSVRYSGGAVEIYLALKIEYGVRINKCVETVQNAVRNGVQNMSGIAVSRVNVKICGQN